MIKRVMRSGIKAAVIEGAVATLLIMIFAPQFCGLFGVTEGEALASALTAIRIVCLGFIFCSTVSLTTSYYMLIDRIGMATCIACFQNGLLYILLPIAGSLLFGINGLWAGFAVAPVLTLLCALLFVYKRFGKDNFPFLLKDMKSEIVILDDVLTPATASALSERVAESLLSHQYPKDVANLAALFTEEIGLTVLDVNKQSKKPVLVELSLLFEDDHVLIIERDSGKLFDLTDPDAEIKGLSGFVLSSLMEAHDEKAYLVTTGYNRNMIRFSRTELEGKRYERI